MLNISEFLNVYHSGILLSDKLYNNYSFIFLVNGIRIWQNKEIVIKRSVIIQGTTEY